MPVDVVLKKEREACQNMGVSQNKGPPFCSVLKGSQKEPPTWMRSPILSNTRMERFEILILACRTRHRF